MATFAQIQEEIGNILDIPDEELTEEQRLAMNAYLDELGAQEAEKVDGFAQFVRLQSEKVKAIKDESRRLADRAKAIENRLAGLKAHYKYTMEQNGLKKVSGDIYTLSLRKSEKLLTPEDPETLAALHKEFPLYFPEKTTWSADKTEIKAALKEGHKIPYCSIEENMNLQIR